MTTEKSLNTQGTSRGFWFVLIAIFGLSGLLMLLVRLSAPLPHGGRPAGDVSPTLNAAGWLQGEAPTARPAEGTIRVVHAWFTTCPACVREAPELVRLYETYHSRGVEFVGLTFEPPERLPEIREFLQARNVTWVNGYGALETLQEFNAEYFPSAWIVDSQGQILWSQDSAGTLEEGIQNALAQ